MSAERKATTVEHAKALRSVGEAEAGPAYGRHGLGKSFRFAAQGLAFALRTQRNLRIHFAAAGLVLFAAAALPVSRIESLLLLGAMVLVPLAELFNTAIEAVVDLAAPHFHPLAKTAKDVAAAAVLLASAFALGIGVLVFAEKLWPLQVREGAAGYAAAVAPLALALFWPFCRGLFRR
ncbi:diacylglycerol kinase family protein [Vulgatibacter sp.]|uniref:diacylglycerol kinase family protein n=1 Tax=Vulgatibacter sp. TaxID=1971226 RepID=UPI0035657179